VNSTYSQLGIGGIFVLLLLQLLLPWLLKVVARTNGKQNALKSGELDPAYWKGVLREINEETMQRGMVQFIKPSLDAQTDILREIRDTNRGIQDGVRQLVLSQEAAERRGKG
jgi:hypothetical protein